MAGSLLSRSTLRSNEPARAKTAEGYLRGHAPVTTKGASYNQGVSNGTVTSGTSRIQHKVVASTAGLRLVYGNCYGLSGAQQDGPNTISVKAALEDASGNIWPVSFGGVRTVAIDPGQVAVSDPMPAVVTTGDLIYSRTYVSVASAGMKWPLGITGNPSLNEGNNYGSPGADLADSGGISTAFQFMYSPMAIIAAASGVSIPTVVQCGDSIIDGQGDSPTHDNGWLVRALNGTKGYIRISQPGERANQFVTEATSTTRLKVLAICGVVQYAVVLLGTNDLANGNDAATIETNLTKIYNRLAGFGAKVFGTTIPPRTTSTDLWATTVNQSLFSTESIRVAVNTWIRTTPAPLTGYVEFADVLETSRNSGIWKVNGTANYYTLDGTHPSAQGHTDASAVVPVSLFT